MTWLGPEVVYCAFAFLPADFGKFNEQVLALGIFYNRIF
jgi:hypothetical protein